MSSRPIEGISLVEYTLETDPTILALAPEPSEEEWGQMRRPAEGGVGGLDSRVFPIPELDYLEIDQALDLLPMSQRRQASLAVMALERIDSAESRAHLASLASGAVDQFPTQEAARSLARLRAAPGAK